MNVLQQHQFWAGAGFALIAVGFLIYAFKAKNLSRGQHNIIRFICALGAGAAGGFLAGSALLNIDAQSAAQNTKLAFQGTAGFALFALVWWTFPKYEPDVQAGDDRNISIGVGWDLQQTIVTIAEVFSVAHTVDGLTDEELRTPMQQKQIRAPSFEVAIEQLNKVVSKSVRTFKAVQLGPGNYKIKV